MIIGILYAFIKTLFFFFSLLLIPIILIQKSKSSASGAFGRGGQMLFGASGGQDFLQKVTWVLGTIFLAGSLFLSVIETKQGGARSQYARTETPAQE